MKFVLKIILTFLISVTISSDIVIAAETITTPTNVSNLKVWDENSTWVNWTVKENTHLEKLQNNETDFSISKWWQKWISDSLRRIARDLKNLFFLIAWLYFLILVLRLLFSDKTEEEASNFKKWIIWTSLWIIITQISYYFINILFDKNVNIELAKNFIDIIIHPFITLLETSASFLFLWIMFFAFFKLVTANWDEEAAKTWKMAVLYAAIWFIVVKISRTLVTTSYWKTNCTSVYQTNCVNDTNITWFALIIVEIINWMNGFIWIVVILMIIYAWFITITSAWDEETLKKAKSSIIYIIIWLTILTMNYLILTFFILDPSTGASPIV